MSAVLGDVFTHFDVVCLGECFQRVVDVSFRDVSLARQFSGGRAGTLAERVHNLVLSVGERPVDARDLQVSELVRQGSRPDEHGRPVGRIVWITSVPARRLGEMVFTNGREELTGGVGVGTIECAPVFTTVAGAVALPTAVTIAGGTDDLRWLGFEATLGQPVEHVLVARIQTVTHEADGLASEGVPGLLVPEGEYAVRVTSLITRDVCAGFLEQLDVVVLDGFRDDPRLQVTELRANLVHENGVTVAIVVASIASFRPDGIAHLDSDEVSVVEPPAAALFRVENRHARHIRVGVALPDELVRVCVETDDRSGTTEVGGGPDSPEPICLVDHDCYPFAIPEVGIAGIVVESRWIVTRPLDRPIIRVERISVVQRVEHASRNRCASA
jgi:hypothetical protein